MIDCAAKAVQLTIEAVCPAAPELLHEVPASAHMIAGERHHTIPLNASKSYSQSHMPLQLTWTVLGYFNSSQLPDTVPAGTQVVGDDLPEANLMVYSPGTYVRAPIQLATAPPAPSSLGLPVILQHPVHPHSDPEPMLQAL